jgi:hypothetical protein
MYSGAATPPIASESALVQRLVRAVVVAAHHVRDPEVEHRRRRLRGDRWRNRPRAATSRPSKRCGRPRGRLAVALLAIALAHRPLVPLDPEPAQIVEDRLLATREVAAGSVSSIRSSIVLGEVAVGDRAERVANVERAGRARSEADFTPPSLGFLFSALVRRRSADPPERLGELAREHPDRVRVSLRDLRQHLEVLVGEQLLVGVRPRGSP